MTHFLLGVSLVIEKESKKYFCFNFFLKKCSKYNRLPTEKFEKNVQNFITPMDINKVLDINKVNRIDMIHISTSAC